uniref:Uncharacterized protein n=1 Tax=Anopheles minimus TaxID=112268 RepID=A0A182WPQ1_9DIPT
FTSLWQPPWFRWLCARVCANVYVYTRYQIPAIGERYEQHKACKLNDGIGIHHATPRNSCIHFEAERLEGVRTGKAGENG